MRTDHEVAFVKVSKWISSLAKHSEHYYQQESSSKSIAREDIDITGDRRLNITSHDIKEYFTDPRHPIVPWKHHRYSSYFESRPPDIALTYEWSTTFKQMRAFLDPSNIKWHNRAALDPNPSLAERLYLMSFAWVALGPLNKIPPEIEEQTIFVDIMYNDQTNADNIEQELEIAEGYYKEAKHHVVLGTRSVLERAWCLYEIAARREAGKRSQVLFVGTEGAVQMEQVNVGLSGMLHIIYTRLLFLGIVPLWYFGIDWTKEFFFAFSGIVKIFGSDASFNYFQNMTASKVSDLEGIRAKICKVFGENTDNFDHTIGSATLRASCSRVVLSLLLWLETVLVVALIPVNAAMAVLSLSLVAALALPVLCCTRGRSCFLFWDLEDTAKRMLALNMSPLAVLFIQNWLMINTILNAIPVIIILFSILLVWVIIIAIISSILFLAEKAWSLCLRSPHQQPVAAASEAPLSPAYTDLVVQQD